MKSAILALALALSSATVLATPDALQVHGPEQRDVNGHSELAARSKYTFVVQCSPYKGKDGKARKGAKEACNTMCFGVKCHFQSNTYTFDGASEAKKNQRRTKAGCNPTKTNICKTDKRFKTSMSGCDEFPLASTSEADSVTQIFRCVPPVDNKSQGGQAKKAMEAADVCNKKYPCSFSFSFEGTTPYKYCKANPSCKPDGNFFTKGGKAVTKRDLEDDETRVEEGGYYVLRSGATIFSPTDLEIGSFAVRSIYANQTIDEAEEAHLMARGLFMDDDEDDYEDEMISDEVMRKL